MATTRLPNLSDVNQKVIDKITATIDGATYNLKLIESGPTSRRDKVLIINKLGIDQYCFDDIIDCVLQTNYTNARRFYRDLANQRDSEKRSTFKNAVKTFLTSIDDVFDFGVGKIKEYRKNISQYIAWVDVNKDGDYIEVDKKVDPDEINDVINVIIHLINQNQKVHDIFKDCGSIEPQTNSVRDNLELNDVHLRKMYNIDKEHSIVNDLIKVK